MSNSKKWRVAPITAAQTYPLREAVLRPGKPLEAVQFDGDDDATTVHLGALADNKIVAIASWYREKFSGSTAHNQWRLRGMAVAPQWQRSGCGRALIEAALQALKERGAEQLWCNARLHAVPFYRALGFEVCSDEFEIPDVGPHVVMVRHLGL
jgi:predicted GNAT family N-acyltransferase